MADDYTPEAMAKAIIELTTDRLIMFKQASKDARKVLNAEFEVAKICDLLKALTGKGADSRATV